MGGAGFIGSHIVDAFLAKESVQHLTIYDNFSTGKSCHYEHHLHDKRLRVIQGEVADISLLTQAMQGHDLVVHLASNADISVAFSNPSIDFKEGIALTQHVLEAARLTRVKRLIYTSGSGVYGDRGEHPCVEDEGNMHPISPYGASKLAGEAFVSSYCHMFGLSASVFRFANVVGPRQTHGVGYDFVNRLLKNNKSLTILGDGLQSKSYIHVDDIVSAVLLVTEKMQSVYEVYNVATEDFISVREIAGLIVNAMGLDGRVSFEYTGGARGWQGDIPIVRLNTQKLRALGFSCQYSSAESIRKAALSMLTNGFKCHEPAMLD